MKQFRYNPVEYQNHIDEIKVNEELRGAIHIETYTIDEERFGGLKTLIVFAFYPDEPKLSFEDIYENYVIYEQETRSFIGTDTQRYRVARREDADRFTKSAAIKYLESGCFIEKDKTYTIQNAQ